MEIAKPVVNQGISQWCTMAEEWEREEPQLRAAVYEALAAEPWGAAAEGVAFKAAHFRGDGPTQMLKQSAHLTKEITDAGDRMRKTIDNTLRTHAATYQDLFGLTREI
ncbi:hypothetical protein AB0F17_07705 [Nonomuraea sp. NPDC026600]|uniref:hypothetical protein n=1 Tax=Nonomuraea sp. NPDC026600 TaxID=3155363 RepID=UPI0033CAD5DB